MSVPVTIGNFSSGMVKNRESFYIDNNAFWLIYNSQTWRGRIRRKRGTLEFSRLARKVQRQTGTSPWFLPPVAPVGGGSGSSFDLLSAITPTPLAGASVVPGSLALTFNGDTFTDPAKNGQIVSSNPAVTATINYSTSIITFSTTGTQLTGTYSYYPTLPVLGLREDIYTADDPQFPRSLAFDTEKAYEIENKTIGYVNISYYKRTQNPVTWTGLDYQLFWTAAFADSVWVTNGKPGFQFQAIASTASAAVTTITTAAPHNLISGDYVFFSEVAAPATALNNTTQIVTVTTPTAFTVPIVSGATVASGIFQKLTTSNSAQGDGIRYLDREPTNNTGLPVDATRGWVNFSPPINAANSTPFGLPSGRYYLVGATTIIGYKDRLIFFGPYLQTATGSPIQIPQGIVWCWNGTPYYATGLQPPKQTANATAWHTDVAGRGGYLGTGVGDKILSVSRNEDVLIVGFAKSQRRVAYTGNDLLPFEFYTINAEYGTNSTLSTVLLDRGVLAFGINGLTITSQTECQRIDLNIPDEVYRIQGENNGDSRVFSGRDFTQELIYFNFPTNLTTYRFPDTTLTYNYRDQSWSIYSENYTSRGIAYESTGVVWDNLPYETWDDWNEIWDSGSLSKLYAQNIAGTPQGYVVVTGLGTGEAPTRFIQSIVVSGSQITITSRDHCFSPYDARMPKGTFIKISNCLGTSGLNDNVYEIDTVIDQNRFTIIGNASGAYLGSGEITFLPIPSIRTKQFNLFWEQNKKTRIGAQSYLLDTTPNGAVEVNMYLSQNQTSPYNSPPLFPAVNTKNSALLYNNILSTAAEANDLQAATALQQAQIWKRYSQSQVGDTVQIGLTLPDVVILDYDRYVSEFVLHGITFTATPASFLA